MRRNFTRGISKFFRKFCRIRNIAGVLEFHTKYTNIYDKLMIHSCEQRWREDRQGDQK